jgi:hypothetical protein
MGLFFNGPRPAGNTSDPTYQRILASGSPQAVAHARAAYQDGGILDAIARGAANNATFQGADAAAGDATFPLDANSSTAPGWGQRFDENLDNQYLRSKADMDAHPKSTAAGNFIGGVLNPISRYIAIGAPNLLSAIAGRAVSGALNGDAYSQRLHDQGAAQWNDIVRAMAFGVLGGGYTYLRNHGLGPNPVGGPGPQGPGPADPASPSPASGESGGLF